MDQVINTLIAIFIFYCIFSYLIALGIFIVMKSQGDKIDRIVIFLLIGTPGLIPLMIGIMFGENKEEENN